MSHSLDFNSTSPFFRSRIICFLFCWQSSRGDHRLTTHWVRRAVRPGDTLMMSAAAFSGIGIDLPAPSRRTIRNPRSSAGSSRAENGYKQGRAINRLGPVKMGRITIFLGANRCPDGFIMVRLNTISPFESPARQSAGSYGLAISPCYLVLQPHKRKHQPNRPF